MNVFQVMYNFVFLLCKVPYLTEMFYFYLYSFEDLPRIIFCILYFIPQARIAKEDTTMHFAQRKVPNILSEN